MKQVNSELPVSSGIDQNPEDASTQEKIDEM